MTEATISNLDLGKMNIGTLHASKIKPMEEPPMLYSTSVKIVANTSNWRKVMLALIGDEPVTYAERSKKDTLRKFPIVNIFSEDEEALERVLTKAAEVE